MPKQRKDAMVKNRDKPAIPDGLVTHEDYDKLVDSKFFKEIESYSNDFIKRVGRLIKSYNIRWVYDPLHQWSRQWEYPYVISRMSGLKSNAKVVDLGAGMSFLPYYLKDKMGLSVLAVDYDKMLRGLYKKVNAEVGTDVEFQFGDMRNLAKINTGSMDFVYSVSVLEHTNDYTKILKEIHRILKPGGKLCFTFDISLDGLDDIPLSRAKELIASLERVFRTKVNIDLNTDAEREGWVISRQIAARNKSLMPWRYPVINVIKHLLNHSRFGHRYKNLTFCCLTVSK